MSPRRMQRDRAMVPRRMRRGIGTSTGSAQPGLLTFASTPAASYVNRVAGGGCTIQLADAVGAPIGQAGVPVTVRMALGAAVTVAATPSATVTTDALGRAVFTGFTFQGTAGQYSLVFEATGYTGASAQVSVTPGAAVASRTTATVPAGSVGQPTTITVTPRDADDNVLESAPGSTTVQVSGANTVPQTTLTSFTPGTGYSFAYTPSASGTDTVTIRQGGTGIAGSPFTSTVAAAGAFPASGLRYGKWDTIDMIGKGPTWGGSDWTTAAPIYTAVMGGISANNLKNAINQATALDVQIWLIMPGSKGTYAVDAAAAKLVYSDTKFKANIDAYYNHADKDTFVAAMASRRVIIMAIDEPWLTKTLDTYTPDVVREMYRYIKFRFPNCIITARFEPNYIKKNYSPSATAGGVPANGNLGNNFYDKLDYSWATWRGDRAPSAAYATPPSYDFPGWVAYARDANKTAGYGTVWGINWPNLGDYGATCWDARNDGTMGRRIGEQGTPRGGFITCATADNGGGYWVLTPQQQRDYLAAILADSSAATDQAPALFGWTHWGLSSQLNAADTFRPIETQPNLVQLWKDLINGGKGRSAAFAWRTPK